MDADKKTLVDDSKQLAAQAIVEGKAKLVVGTTVFNHIFNHIASNNNDKKLYTQYKYYNKII